MKIVEAASPNFDERRLPISILVLHYTGMESAEAALVRMRDPDAKVSAHYMVDELGQVFQLVKDNMRAWHAGVSCWRAEQDVNSASIGIEIVNGGHDYGLPDFPDRQIRAVIDLSKIILSQHPISQFDIVGHSDIAPARKQDPGERFPWRNLAKNNVGFWPDIEVFNAMPFAPNSSNRQWKNSLLRALSSIGYDVDHESFSDVLTAVQRRYRTALINGALDIQTLRIIERLALAGGKNRSTAGLG